MGFTLVWLWDEHPDRCTAPRRSGRVLGRLREVRVAPSRAALVARAVEREMRRQRAEGDVAILRSAGAADDLDELVAWSATRAVAEG